MLATIFAVRIVTTLTAIGMLVSFFMSETPKEKWALWQARAWAFMCAAVCCFGAQYFVLEQFGLPIQHPMRQVSIGLALGLMWPSFQCARASVLYRSGASDRAVRADQFASLGVGLGVVALCNVGFWLLRI